MIRFDKVYGLSEVLLAKATAQRRMLLQEEARQSVVDALFIATAEGNIQVKAGALRELAWLQAEIYKGTFLTKLKRLFRKANAESDVGRSAAELALTIYRSFGVEEQLNEYERCVADLSGLEGNTHSIDVAVWLQAQKPGILVHKLQSAAILRGTSHEHRGGFHVVLQDLDYIRRLAESRGAAQNVTRFTAAAAQHYSRNQRPYMAIFLLERLLASTVDERVKMAAWDLPVSPYFQIGDLEAARSCIEKAKAKDPTQVAQKGASEGDANMLLRQANFLIEERRFDEAKDLLLAANRMAEIAGKGRTQAHVMHAMGLLFHRQGDYGAGEESYLKAIRLANGLPKFYGGDGDQEGFDPYIAAHSAASLGSLYVKWGRFEQAVRFLVEAYWRYNTLDSPKVEFCKQWIGKIVEEIGEAEMRVLEQRASKVILEALKCGELQE